MPLGSPRRPERDICPEDVADMQTPEMQEIAKAHGVHPALIALKWAHQRGEISIPFSVHNYVSNLKCVTEDPLTEEEMAKIGTLERGTVWLKARYSCGKVQRIGMICGMKRDLLLSKGTALRPVNHFDN